MLGRLNFKSKVMCAFGACVVTLFVNYGAFVVFWKETEQLRKLLIEDEGYAEPYRNDIPLVIWWTNFVKNKGQVRHCGEVSCYFTNQRELKNNGIPKALLFYGSDLELSDLPLPRLPNDQWVVIHEESPKNNWMLSNKPFMDFFNMTATFNRHSDYPLTLQWLTTLEDIESKTYYHTVEEKNKFIKEEGLAPVAFIHSDCEPPSDRDSLVTSLSRYIKIDCLGKCLHNKDLPKHLSNPVDAMHHKDFYKLLSKYKFIIAAENAVCEDYITEKLWRSFYVGAVPIVYGSPSVKDWLPTPRSALLVANFSSIRALADAIVNLNSDDHAYSQAVSYKTSGITNPLLKSQMRSREWSLDNPGHSYFDIFPCHVCQQLHGIIHFPQKERNRALNCPVPKRFSPTDDKLFSDDNKEYIWQRIYEDDRIKAIHATELLQKNAHSISQRYLDDMVAEHYMKHLNENKIT